MTIPPDSILDQLYELLLERKNADPDSSYVASLYNKGLDSILKKVGEEATEVVIAAKGDDKKALIYELTDLCFHSMILMAEKGISPDDIKNEMERRFGTSGITEKESRNKESK